MSDFDDNTNKIFDYFNQVRFFLDGAFGNFLRLKKYREKLLEEARIHQDIAYISEIRKQAAFLLEEINNIQKKIFEFESYFKRVIWPEIKSLKNMNSKALYLNQIENYVRINTSSGSFQKYLILKNTYVKAVLDEGRAVNMNPLDENIIKIIKQDRMLIESIIKETRNITNLGNSIYDQFSFIAGKLIWFINNLDKADKLLLKNDQEAKFFLANAISFFDEFEKVIVPKLFEVKYYDRTLYEVMQDIVHGGTIVNINEFKPFAVVLSEEHRKTPVKVITGKCLIVALILLMGAGIAMSAATAENNTVIKIHNNMCELIKIVDSMQHKTEAYFGQNQKIIDQFADKMFKNIAPGDTIKTDQQVNMMVNAGHNQGKLIYTRVHIADGVKDQTTVKTINNVNVFSHNVEQYYNEIDRLSHEGDIEGLVDYIFEILIEHGIRGDAELKAGVLAEFENVGK